MQKCMPAMRKTQLTTPGAHAKVWAFDQKECKMNTAQFAEMAFPKLVKATGDPTAPIKLQEAYVYATAVGKMLAARGEKAKAIDYCNRLLSGLSKADKASSEPEFVAVTASLFCEALIAYVRRVAEDPPL
jgi:hypothetical protein